MCKQKIKLLFFPHLPCFSFSSSFSSSFFLSTMSTKRIFPSETPESDQSSPKRPKLKHVRSISCWLLGVKGRLLKVECQSWWKEKALLVLLEWMWNVCVELVHPKDAEVDYLMSRRLLYLVFDRLPNFMDDKENLQILGGCCLYWAGCLSEGYGLGMDVIADLMIKPYQEFFEAYIKVFQTVSDAYFEAPEMHMDHLRVTELIYQNNRLECAVRGYKQINGGEDVVIKSMRRDADGDVSCQQVGEIIVHWFIPSHENVLLPLKVFVGKSKLSIVYPKGQNLDFDPAKLRGRARDILLGLSHTHKNGWSHRDLKPENLVEFGGRVTLIDFGATSSTDHLARQWPVCTSGTSPSKAELDDCDNYCGDELDIFSYGATLIAMANNNVSVGEDSFSSAHGTRYHHFATHGLPATVQDILGEEGVDLVTACMHKDPKQRPSAEKLLKSHPYVQ
jgi:hypothetical protein